MSVSDLPPEELVTIKMVEPTPVFPGLEDDPSTGTVAVENEPLDLPPDAPDGAGGSLIPPYLTEEEWVATRLRCYCGMEFGPDDTGTCPSCGRGYESRKHPADWAYTDGGVHL